MAAGFILKASSQRIGQYQEEVSLKSLNII